MAALVKANPISNAGFSVPLVVFNITSQTSTASEVVVTGSAANIAGFPDIYARLNCITQDVTVTIYLANTDDFTDEFLYRTYALTAATAQFWLGAQTGTGAAPVPSPYIRFKIIDTSGGSHGVFSMQFAAGR